MRYCLKRTHLQRQHARYRRVHKCFQSRNSVFVQSQRLHFSAIYLLPQIQFCKAIGNAINSNNPALPTKPIQKRAENTSLSNKNAQINKTHHTQANLNLTTHSAPPPLPLPLPPPSPPEQPSRAAQNYSLSPSHCQKHRPASRSGTSTSRAPQIQQHHPPHHHRLDAAPHSRWNASSAPLPLSQAYPWW